MAPDVVFSLLNEKSDAGGILGSLLKRLGSALVSEDDLEHLCVDITAASQLIRGATEQKKHSCNILIWDPPGTGKTQIARYLGQTLELDTYDVRHLAVTTRC